MNVAVKILVRERDGIGQRVTFSRRHNLLVTIDVVNVTHTGNISVNDPLRCSRNDEMAHVYTISVVGP